MVIYEYLFYNYSLIFDVDRVSRYIVYNNPVGRHDKLYVFPKPSKLSLVLL